MTGYKFNLTSQLTRQEIIGLVFRLTLFGALSYVGIKFMVQYLDPTRKQKIESQKRAERILKRIGLNDIKLSEYELSIAAQLVDPQTINVSWEDIAGLEDIIQEIRETVILPIQKRDLFAGSSLIQPPKVFWEATPSPQKKAKGDSGVLLHGPPGCGKTMIAKATAKEAGARFINLEVSALTDKWYGESQKLAAAVFTLAVKIQPCIVFIDEIDSFLRSRDTHDHEATAMMKAQFMSLWDGLITDPDCQVIVMGATNRPQDVDRAILRRMPSMFHIGLPNLNQRAGVLKLVLESEVVSDDIEISHIGKMTEGFSGSDLRELCRNAALYRVRDYLKEENQKGESDCVASSSDAECYHDALRPINMEDFNSALQRMKESKVHSGTFRQSGFDLD